MCCTRASRDRRVPRKEPQEVWVNCRVHLHRLACHLAVCAARRREWHHPTSTVGQGTLRQSAVLHVPAAEHIVVRTNGIVTRTLCVQHAAAHTTHTRGRNTHRRHGKHDAALGLAP